jgi:hypothetical protein
VCHEKPVSQPVEEYGEFCTICWQKARNSGSTAGIDSDAEFDEEDAEFWGAAAVDVIEVYDSPEYIDSQAKFDEEDAKFWGSAACEVIEVYDSPEYIDSQAKFDEEDAEFWGSAAREVIEVYDSPEYIDSQAKFDEEDAEFWGAAADGNLMCSNTGRVVLNEKLGKLEKELGNDIKNLLYFFKDSYCFF